MSTSTIGRYGPLDMCTANDRLSPVLPPTSVAERELWHAVEPLWLAHCRRAETGECSACTVGDECSTIEMYGQILADMVYRYYLRHHNAGNV